MGRMRASPASEEGRQLYAKRAGIEGTLSHSVRAFGLRRRRDIGLANTHLRQVASAAALNLDRLAAWLMHRRRAHTRVSRLAALAGCGRHSPAVSVGFIDAVGVIGRFQQRPIVFLRFRRIPLDPAKHGGVVDSHAALPQELLRVTTA